MANSPTDLGEEFVNSGRRLITQQSSDELMEKAKERKNAEEKPDDRRE